MLTKTGHLTPRGSRAATPLAPASRESLSDAIRALDDLLYIVEQHFLGTHPTVYDHLDSLGGSTCLLDIVQQDCETETGSSH